MFTPFTEIPVEAAVADLPFNADLLTDVVTWAAVDHDHNEEAAARFAGWGGWDQTQWATELRNGACRSSFCIAGQVVTQVGYGLVFERSWQLDDDGHRGFGATYCAPRLFDGLDKHGAPKYRLADVSSELIPNVAENALGITHDEAEALFNGENGIADVVTLAVVIAARRGRSLTLTDDVLRHVTEVTWDDAVYALGLNYADAG